MSWFKELYSNVAFSIRVVAAGRRRSLTPLLAQVHDTEWRDHNGDACRYTTHLVGKWHAGMSHPSLVPGARGFDESLGYRTLPSPFANSGLSSFLSGYFLFETDPDRLLTRLTFTVAGSEDHWLHTNGGPTCGSKNKTAACCVDMFNTTQPVLDAKARYTGVREKSASLSFRGRILRLPLAMSVGDPPPVSHRSTTGLSSPSGRSKLSDGHGRHQCFCTWRGTIATTRCRFQTDGRSSILLQRTRLGGPIRQWCLLLTPRSRT